jgi:hypothetical protein
LEYTDTSVNNGTTYTYYVTAIYRNPDGESSPSNAQTVTPMTTTDLEVIPEKTELYGNYPNPFNPTTSISFSVGANSVRQGHSEIATTNVRIDIFNLKGQKIKTLCDRHFNPGTYRIDWNGTDELENSVSSGIYLYRMRTEGYNSIKRMLLLK